MRTGRDSNHHLVSKVIIVFIDWAAFFCVLRVKTINLVDLVMHPQSMNSFCIFVLNTHTFIQSSLFSYNTHFSCCFVEFCIRTSEVHVQYQGGHLRLSPFCLSVFHSLPVSLLFLPPHSANHPSTPTDVISASVYTWGSNSNITLGHDHSRNHPERVDLAGDY